MRTVHDDATNATSGGEFVLREGCGTRQRYASGAIDRASIPAESRCPASRQGAGAFLRPGSARRLTTERPRADTTPARLSTKVIDARSERRIHALVEQRSDEDRASMREEIARVRAWAERWTKAVREA